MMKRYSIFPIAAFFILVLSVTTFANENEDNGKPSWQRDPLVLDVVLQTQYIDGSIEQETRKETVWSLDDFWAGYSDWKVMVQQEGKVVFRKKMNDLSPAVKKHGYFGIDDNNVLSIFNGKPSENKVMKAFYQIDVGKLESYRLDRLKKGIKVDKKDTFENVIRTFKEYASSEPVNEEG